MNLEVMNTSNIMLLRIYSKCSLQSTMVLCNIFRNLIVTSMHTAMCKRSEKVIQLTVYENGV